MRADDLEALLEAPLKRLDPRQSAPLAPSDQHPTSASYSGPADTNTAARSTRYLEERSRNEEYEYFADGNSGNGRARGRQSDSDLNSSERGRDDRDRGYHSRREVVGGSREDRQNDRRSRSPRKRRDRSYSRSPVRRDVPSRHSVPSHHSTPSIPPPPPPVRHTAPSQPPTTPSGPADKRTVFVRQIGQRATERDVRELCEREIGAVLAVKLVYDRITRRHKGVAYVEFAEEQAVPKALAMTGIRLAGVPLIFELTEAEKNRIAAEAAIASNMNNNNSANSVAQERRDECAVLVEPLAPHVTEADLLAFFAPSTTPKRVLVLGETAAVIDFSTPSDAARAVAAFDRHILCNRQVRLRVVDRAHGVPPRRQSAIGGDGGGEDEAYLTPQQRAELMLKLARSRS